MNLEGSNAIVDLPEAKISITLTNTNVRELSRLYTIIQTMFNQGVFNTRNGSRKLHFNDEGELRGIDIEASTWRDGKQVVTRVAVFDNAVVEIIDTSVVK